MKTVNDFVYQWLIYHQISVKKVTLPCDTFDWMDKGLRKEILKNKDYTVNLNEWMLSFKENAIYHIKDAFLCNYTIYRLPEPDRMMVCGPILFDEMKTEMIQKVIMEHRMPEEMYDSLQEYYSQIPYLSSFSLYLNLFSELFDSIYGKNRYETIYCSFDEAQWYQQFSYSEEYQENSLSDIMKTEKQYEIENALLDYILKGNESKAMETYVFYQSYILAKKADKLQDVRDMTVSFHTLFRKAAQEAGIHPVKIEACSRQICRELDKILCIDDCYRLQKRMVSEYCRLIQNYQLNEYSRLIQKVIIYIEGNLQNDLTLKTLASLLAITPGYLSTQFRKETGQPLTLFVNRKRISQSQKLLLTSDLPIKTIAEKCGISDIYYFGKLFKRITGTTPKAYRESGNYFSAQDTIFSQKT